MICIACWTLASPTDNACELKCEVYKPFHAYILYKVLYFPNEALLCPVPRVIMSIRKVNKSKKKSLTQNTWRETRSVLDFEFYHNLGYFHTHVCVWGREKEKETERKNKDAMRYRQGYTGKEIERDLGADI